MMRRASGGATLLLLCSQLLCPAFATNIRGEQAAPQDHASLSEPWHGSGWSGGAVTSTPGAFISMEPSASPTLQQPTPRMVSFNMTFFSIVAGCDTLAGNTVFTQTIARSVAGACRWPEQRTQVVVSVQQSCRERYAPVSGQVNRYDVSTQVLLLEASASEQVPGGPASLDELVSLMSGWGAAEYLGGFIGTHQLYGAHTVA